MTTDRETVREVERQTMAVFSRVNPTQRNSTVGDRSLALAFRVGGCGSIALLAQKRPSARSACRGAE